MKDLCRWVATCAAEPHPPPKASRTLDYLEGSYKTLQMEQRGKRESKRVGSPMPMEVVVRKMSQKMMKSPVSLRGKNTMAEKTKELTRVMLISSIILNMT